APSAPRPGPSPPPRRPAASRPSETPRPPGPRHQGQSPPAAPREASTIPIDRTTQPVFLTLIVPPRKRAMVSGGAGETRPGAPLLRHAVAHKHTLPSKATGKKIYLLQFPKYKLQFDFKGSVGSQLL